MKKLYFTKLDYHYENDSWNPVIETQSDTSSEEDSKEQLSSIEKEYILSYKKVWDKLSKF
jgi:hypothetical protein